MMSWGMEVLSPAFNFQTSNLFLSSTKPGTWTLEENKTFERALAIHDKEAPDRWQKVAEMIPGKSVDEVMKHYKDLEDDVSHIEAGLVPIPGYSSSTFTLDWASGRGFDALRQSFGGGGGGGGKRLGARPPDHERKKGVPWTEEEHRMFLLGLKKYGKGDWRNIARNFVTSRTPTQVASHAQKYFIRLSSGGKDKRRSSIHDITTVNLQDNRPPSPSHDSGSLVSSVTTERFSVTMDSNQQMEQAVANVFDPAIFELCGNSVSQPPYGISAYGMKFEGHPNMLFQMQPTHCNPHG